MEQITRALSSLFLLLSKVPPWPAIGQDQQGAWAMQPLGLSPLRNRVEKAKARRRHLAAHSKWPFWCSLMNTRYWQPLKTDLIGYEEVALLLSRNQSLQNCAPFAYRKRREELYLGIDLQPIKGVSVPLECTLETAGMGRMLGWVSACILALTTHMTTCTFTNLTGCRFPHLPNGGTNIYWTKSQEASVA